jgi:hypothetical protein
MNTLPILEGVGRLNNPLSKLHCADVLDAIAVSNAARVKLLKDPEDQPFWTREGHANWRNEQWEWMYKKEKVSMRCTGQALLSREEMGIASAESIRKHLKKQFGGASEDVKFRETPFENGMHAREGKETVLQRNRHRGQGPTTETGVDRVSPNVPCGQQGHLPVR